MNRPLNIALPKLTALAYPNTTTPRATLRFCGGVGAVTGANFLLEVLPEMNKGAGEKIDQKKPKKSFQILVDCGLEQGSEFAEASNREPFPYDPAGVDILLVTHAHADHIGRIPKLVRDGFHGSIYSTPATRDLAQVMLADSLHILAEEARQNHVPPLYEQADVTAAFALWKTIPYYTPMDIGSSVSVLAKDSGHILGSAMYELTIGTHICPGIGGFSPHPSERSKLASARSVNGKLTIVFTGDLGNSPALFLRDTDSIAGADYIVMESVYGDRNHESKEERRAKLASVIADTAHRKRALVIPAFSLERTQDILFEINELERAGKVPVVPVYLDSPLASAVTEVYSQYSSDFNSEARKMLAADKRAEGNTADLFTVSKFKQTVTSRESQKIDDLPNPKIIIAGSGMSHGGRVRAHEKRLLSDPNVTILLVGYQSLGTLGRQLEDGARQVDMDGQKIPVKAEIKTIFGYSSHKDSDHLVEFIADAAGENRDASVIVPGFNKPPTVKKVFVAMGEPKSALFLAQRLRDYIGVNAVVPRKGDSVTLY
jgi:metallo-beta-lactamase family protein